MLGGVTNLFKHLNVLVNMSKCEISTRTTVISFSCLVFVASYSLIAFVVKYYLYMLFSVV